MGLVIYGSYPDRKIGASNLIYDEIINYYSNMENIHNTVILYSPRGNKNHLRSIQISDDGKEINVIHLHNRKSSFEEEFDVVLALDIKAASLLKNLNAKLKVAWLGDIEYMVIFEHYLASIRNRKITFFDFPRVILKMGKSMIAYKIILKSFNLVIVSSRNSINFLSIIGVKSQFLPFPLKFSDRISYLDMKKELGKPKKRVFMFYGNLMGLGSKSAVSELESVFIPALTKTYGKNGFELQITGKYDSQSDIFLKLNKFSEVKFTGFINDIDSEIDLAHYCIFPIKSRVGNRTRIIHAMSLHKVCISHYATSNGNPFLESGMNCILYRNQYDLEIWLQQLKMNELNERQISENAFKSYEKTYKSHVALDRIQETVAQELRRIN